jgi:3-hydroxyisobutyrate dehydrogenase
VSSSSSSLLHQPDLICIWHDLISTQLIWWGSTEKNAGVNGAENASLTIMCGASSPASFERAKPVLGMMGKKVIMCGGLGMGLAAKLCNKWVWAPGPGFEGGVPKMDGDASHADGLVDTHSRLRSMQLGISMLGLSEAMLMGKKLGLDSELLGNIINTSTGQCWASSVSRVFQLVIGLFLGGRGGVGCVLESEGGWALGGSEQMSTWKMKEPSEKNKKMYQNERKERQGRTKA